MPNRADPKNISLRTTFAVVGGMFVATGCAGLLAEQCFEKLLAGLTGSSTPAAAIVLSVYFIGLALGALLYGRYRRTDWKPLKIYGCLEAGIGALTLFLLLTYPWMIRLFTPILMMGADHFWILQSLRFLAACVWIIPLTALMGATFPAVVDALESFRIPKPRQAITRFYALNLIGAIIGTLVGPYWSFPSWGLHGTLIFTAAIDITVAVEILVLSGNIQPKILRRIDLSCMVSNWNIVRQHPVLLTISFFSGFLFFGLEVLWTHLIGAVLGNSIYAFAAMLALVLSALGIGGLLSATIFKEDKPISPLVTGIMLLGASATLVWQYFLWPQVSLLFIKWGGDLTGFWQGELLRWLQAGRLLLPAAITLGMVYPSLFRMSVFPMQNRAQAVAVVSGVNSVGCVLGALLCGFALIPQLGSEQTLLFYGVVAAASGLFLALVYSHGMPRMAMAAAALLLIYGWAISDDWDRLALTSGGHVYFQQGHVNRLSTLEYFHEDTLGGITTVVSNSLPPVPGAGPAVTRRVIKTLLTNGKFQATDGAEVDAQTGFTVIPALHVHRYGDALVIGLGSGQSAGVAKGLGFRKVDIAEISPGIVDAARRHFGHINGSVLDRPDVRLFLEDGRNHLLLHRTKYDQITIELTSVWFSGACSLYSREFYSLCKERLNRGGIIQQWVQIHHIGIDELGSVIATMRQVFPHVSFWVYGGQGILVGSEEPQKIQADAVNTFFRTNPWKDPDEHAIKRRLAGVLQARLLAPEDTDRMLAAIAFNINTDANRFLEYATPRYNLSRHPHAAINMGILRQYATFPKHQPEPAWPAVFANPAAPLSYLKMGDR